MLKKISIRGRYVTYETEEPRISYGVAYLKDYLKPDESEVFFVGAKSKGEAEFEDHDYHKFNLVFQKTTSEGMGSSVDNYILSTRRSS